MSALIALSSTVTPWSLAQRADAGRRPSTVGCAKRMSIGFQSRSCFRRCITLQPALKAIEATIMLRTMGKWITEA